MSITATRLRENKLPRRFAMPSAALIAATGGIIAAAIGIVPALLDQPQAVVSIATLTTEATSPSEALLVVRTILVAATKYDGKPWDLVAGPDLALLIRNRTTGLVDVSRTSKPGNYVEVEIPSVHVSPGDVLDLEVFDTDGLRSDRIGRLNDYIVTEATIQSGRANLGFGLVQQLVLEFRR